jgi:hypothetical protein
MKAAICVAACLLAGCAGQHVKLGASERAALASEAVHVVHLPAAKMFFVESSGYTAAGVLFSPLVVLAQAAEAKSLMDELKLEDPVARVKERLAAALESELRIAKVNRLERAPERSDPESLRKALGTGVVLQVRTENWRIDNNRAKYSASAQLVRLSDGVTLWHAVCPDSIADKDKPSPTTEQLKANGGELLKAKLAQAADACADALVRWAFS